MSRPVNYNKKSITFKSKAEKLISQFEKLLEVMPEKGLKSTDSQKVCLQQALNELSYTVNGVESSDFKPEDDE